jgi:hypothetical protein
LIKRTINDLNTLYQDAESVDSELFAEMRSNILLTSGNHYARKMRDVLARQGSGAANRDQKVRIVRNHLKKITTTYQNNILSNSPAVAIKAKNESELQDQKIAEQATAIWADWRNRQDFDGKVSKLVQDYIEIGEAIVKIFYDPNAGKFAGYEPVIDPMTGQPEIDDQGQPKVIPKFEGEIVCDRILGFNFLRDPEAKAWDEVRWACVRKMVDTKHLKSMVSFDEKLEKLVTESSKTTYQVFDGQNTGYSPSNKSMTLTREFYFKACSDYPQGYFYITTEDGVLFEGELPNGEWPFEVVSFDEFPTSCRGYSIIKQLRPVQAEINRAASAIVQTQLTLGMDKIILRNGSSMEAGNEAHGVKAIKVIGQDPTIMTGRSGEQFVGYLNACISELYAIAMVQEDAAGADNGQVDPYGMLFRTMRQKKKFSIWATKFEKFMVNSCRKVLTLSKTYYTPERLVPILGRNEQVNIAEWMATPDLRYSIVPEAATEDVESKMGRQLSLNHILQYSGSNMSQQDVGKVLRLMPYVNNEKLFDDMTLDYDIATNTILRLDRGEQVQPKPNDNHTYLLSRISNRMKTPDFDFLAPQIQQMYQQVYEAQSQLLAQEQLKVQQMKDGYIPTGGYLVACDFYVSDPKKPDKMPLRARLPYESLMWLMKRLEAQGQGQTELSQLSEGTQADVASLMGMPPTMQGTQIQTSNPISSGLPSQ